MCSLRIVFQVSFNWRGVKPNLQNNQGQDTKDAFFKYSSINLKMTILRLLPLEI